MVSLFSAVAGGAEYSQVDLEMRFVRNLAVSLQIFVGENEGRSPTNLSQIMAVSDLEKMARDEDGLLKFGTNAGFENTILEKYVFMPPGVAAGDSTDGEIVLVGAKTFPGEDGKPMRALVARTADRYRGFATAEYRVQRWLQAANAVIPEPPKLEPLARPPKQRTINDMTAEEIEAILGDPNDPLPKPNAGIFKKTAEAGKAQTNTTALSTNAVLATTEAPSAPTRWWLPVAVLAGLGVIAALLLRARRRGRTP